MSEFKELIEKLAAIEHDRWSDWHAHAAKNWTPENLARWDRQMKAPYAELSEREKESDRREVMRYWHLIEPANTFTIEVIRAMSKWAVLRNQKAVQDAVYFKEADEAFGYLFTRGCEIIKTANEKEPPEKSHIITEIKGGKE